MWFGEVDDQSSRQLSAVSSAFFTTDTGGKTQVLLITLTMVLTQRAKSVSQQVQRQDPDTGAAKWKSATISFMIYTCAVSAVTCRHVFSEKVPNVFQ